MQNASPPTVPHRSVVISTIYWSLLAVLTLGYALLMIGCAALLWWLDPAQKTTHRLGVAWGRSVFGCIPAWKLRVVGRQHLPAHGPVILVSNHQSIFDTMALYGLRYQFKWVAKDSLFKIPLVGWAMSCARYVKLSRGRHGSIRDAYDQARQWLTRGMSVCFFPEGTRSVTGHLGPFKNGAFKLAVETGLPLIPVAVSGTHALLQRGRTTLASTADVRVTVLPPLDPATYRALGPERLRDDAHQRIQRALVRN